MESNPGQTDRHPALGRQQDSPADVATETLQDQTVKVCANNNKSTPPKCWSFAPFGIDTGITWEGDEAGKVSPPLFVRNKSTPQNKSTYVCVVWCAKEVVGVCAGYFPEREVVPSWICKRNRQVPAIGEGGWCTVLGSLVQVYFTSGSKMKKFINSSTLCCRL